MKLYRIYEGLKKVTLISENEGKTYKFKINEADRVEMPHTELLKMATKFRSKLNDKEFLKSTCGFVEADFDDLVISFQGGNNKLNHAFMSLPAGVSCPGAGNCLSFFNPEDSKLYVASENKGSVCYAAALEAGMGPRGTKGAKQYRKTRYNNFYVIESALQDGYNNLAKLIDDSIPKHELDEGPMGEIRIHEDGDFYSEEYFKGWVKAAIMNPETHFYFYTKSLPFLVKYLKNNTALPTNFTPSISTNFNPRYAKHFEYYKALAKGDVKIAKIYDSYDDVPEGVPVDKTDAYAMDPNFKGEFALVYHGTGIKGSKYARLVHKNSRDSRKYKTNEEKLHYLTTVKSLRSRTGEASNINLDY